MSTTLPSTRLPFPPPHLPRQESQPQSNTWPAWTPGEQAAVLIVSVFIGLLILGLAVWLVTIRRKKAREARRKYGGQGKSGGRRGRGVRGERVSSESRIGLREGSRRRDGERERERAYDRQEPGAGVGARHSRRTTDAGGERRPVREQAPYRGILNDPPPTTPPRTRHPRPEALALPAPSRRIQPAAAENALMSGARSKPGSPVMDQLTGRREGNEDGAGARRRSGSGGERRTARAKGNAAKLGRFLGEDAVGVSRALRAAGAREQGAEGRGGGAGTGTGGGGGGGARKA